MDFKKHGMFQVKADVETQGEFVESLASEVRAASFVNIDDVVAFVNWLDEELSFLVSNPTIFFIHHIQSNRRQPAKVLYLGHM
jgi:hypothetical protein